MHACLVFQKKKKATAAVRRSYDVDAESASTVFFFPAVQDGVLTVHGVSSALEQWRMV